MKNYIWQRSKTGVGGKTTISENIKHVDSTGKSKLKQDSNGTKKVITNSTSSTTSNCTVISQKKLSPARLKII